MGEYDDEVKKALTKGPYDAILEAVRYNHIDPQRMKDIAKLLHPSIRGSHKKRERCCEAEMRRILSEWWNLELYKLSKKEALEKLNDDTVNMRPLANKIQKFIPKSSNPKPRRHSSGQWKRDSYQRELSASEMLEGLKDQRDTFMAEIKETRQEQKNHMREKEKIIEEAHKKEIENLKATHQILLTTLQSSEKKQMSKEKNWRRSSVV